MDVLLEAQRTAKRRQRRDYVSESAAGSLLFGLDAALTLLVLVVGFLLAGRGTAPGGWAPAILGSLAVFPFTKYLFGLYPGHGLTRAQRLRQAVLSAGTGLALYLGVAWSAERLGGVRLQVSQAAGALVLAALTVLSDAVGRRLLIGFGRWHQPVFIFGGGDAAREVARQLVLYPHLGYRPACIVDDGSVYIPDEEHGVPVIRFKELSRHADQLGLASTAVVIERLAERSLILQLYTAGIFKHILLVPDCHDLISLRSSIRRVGGTLSIRVASDRPSRSRRSASAPSTSAPAGWPSCSSRRSWSPSPSPCGSTARARSSSASPAGAAATAPSARSSSGPCTPTASAGSGATSSTTRPRSASTRGTGSSTTTRA